MYQEIKVNGKTFKNNSTTVLFTSEFNYHQDEVEFINRGYIVIDKNNTNKLEDISLELLKEFNCEYLLEKNNYSKSEKIKINILSNIKSPKDTIIFFNVLTYLDDGFKHKVINCLKEKEKRIINYTSEIEETLFLQNIIVVHDGKIVMEGKSESVLLEEKILTRLGFKLPTIVELSKGLKYYGVINNIYYLNEELVKDLWK